MPKFRLIDEMGEPVKVVATDNKPSFNVEAEVDAATPQEARDKVFEQFGWTMEMLEDDTSES